MTDLAWMPVYIGDEAVLTGHLTAEEFGAYERLRRHYWQHGHIPEDHSRMMRIAGVEPERWETVRLAIVQLFDADGRMPKLDALRNAAAEKRERKVAAGKAGADARWNDGKGNANANGNRNGKGMATAMAEPMRTQWPPAPAPDEELGHEGLEPTHAHARTHTPAPARGNGIPAFTDRSYAKQWLLKEGAFPGQLDVLVGKAMAGTLEWADL